MLEEGAGPRWLRRLVVLGAEDAAGRLRLSRAEAKALAAVTNAAQVGGSAAVLGSQLGAESAADAVLARAAMTGAAPAADWQEEIARGAAVQFPVKAADLPGLQGADLGKRLKALQSRWLNSGLRLTKADLLD